LPISIGFLKIRMFLAINVFRRLDFDILSNFWILDGVTEKTDDLELKNVLVQAGNGDYWKLASADVAN
jgi:hypothetical protein